jgi:hypothetical protein
MIGIGHQVDKQWVYKCFTISELNDEKEIKMFMNFWLYINSISTKPLFYHWSKAEPILWNKFKNSNQIEWSDKQFYDLHELFIKKEITVKGSLDYSLKNIGKALYNNNLIRIKWPENDCCNGNDAQMIATSIYANKRFDLLPQIIEYNEIDCKMLCEILNLLRVFN